MSRKALIAWAVAPLLIVSCSQTSGQTTGDTSAPTETMRLGHFPNLTHATAIVGVEKGIFTKRLGDVRLEAKTFNAGPDVVTALFSDALDASYIGPGPAINAFSKSNGEAIRIIAGATSGGAYLVVKPEINGPDDLKGKKVASPQLGNTQDVALRAWLASSGLKTDTKGGGDVSVTPQENAQTLETFKSGEIQGAWVPEPWATRLVQEGGGKVLVDERELWPDGKYVTTHLIVRTKYLSEHPDVIRKLLQGHLEADAFVRDHADEAKQVANAGIEKITSKVLTPEVLDAAYSNLTFTVDPIAQSLKKAADDAVVLGLLDRVDLGGIYDLTILNALLRDAGREQIQGL